MRHKYHIFIKYLLSYLLVLFLPLVIINGIYGKKVNSVYREEIMSNMQTDLDILSNEFNSQIASMVSTVNQLSLMVNFNTYDFETNPLSARSIMQLLSMYNSTGTFADEIILYLHDDEYLVSNSSTCRADMFTNWMYQYVEKDPAQMLNLFKSTNKVTILPMQKIKTSNSESNYLTVLVPVYTDYQTVRGTCVFLVKNRSLEQMMNEKLGKYNAQIYITSSNGETLFKSGAFTQDITEIMPLIEDGIYKNSQTKQKFLVETLESDGFDFKFNVFIPQDGGMAKRLGSINKFLLSGTLVVILVAMAVIFVLMKMNYSPIRRLREKAATAFPNYHPKGEIEAIASTLDFLSDQNQYLTSRLEDNVSSIKNIRLQELLCGRYKDSADFNNACADLHLALTGETFFVSSVLVHGNPSDWNDLAEAIKLELPTDYVSYYVFTVQPDKLYFIHCLPQISRTEIVENFENVRNKIESQTDLILTFGIGGFVFSTDAIPKSFLEAGSALDYRFVKGNSNTIVFDEIYSAGNLVTPYPRAKFEKLKNAIISKNDTSTIDCINELIEYMDKNNLPLFAAKGLCFDIISAFLEHSSSDLLNRSEANLISLSEVDTASEVVKQIKSLRDAINCNALPDNITDADILIKQILEYVNEHSLRCDFSVADTSEHFNMLLPNLSQFFKDRTGQNILDYSTNLRMEKAKKLLLDTDIPLKELGYQVGYYNVSSFIRRFKQTQGLTPGDYRNLYGKYKNS